MIPLERASSEDSFNMLYITRWKEESANWYEVEEEYHSWNLETLWSMDTASCAEKRARMIPFGKSHTAQYHKLGEIWRMELLELIQHTRLTDCSFIVAK
jgi:hypothetical protein